MDGGQVATVERTAGEPRDHVIRDAEDHHRDETQQVHVEVRGTIDRPRRMDSHRHAE